MNTYRVYHGKMSRYTFIQKINKYRLNKKLLREGSQPLSKDLTELLEKRRASLMERQKAVRQAAAEKEAEEAAAAIAAKEAEEAAAAIAAKEAEEAEAAAAKEAEEAEAAAAKEAEEAEAAAAKEAEEAAAAIAAKEAEEAAAAAAKVAERAAAAAAKEAEEAEAAAAKEAEIAAAAAAKEAEIAAAAAAKEAEEAEAAAAKEAEIAAAAAAKEAEEAKTLEAVKGAEAIEAPSQAAGQTQAFFAPSQAAQSGKEPAPSPEEEAKKSGQEGKQADEAQTAPQPAADAPLLGSQAQAAPEASAAKEASAGSPAPAQEAAPGIPISAKEGQEAILPNLGEADSAQAPFHGPEGGHADVGAENAAEAGEAREQCAPSSAQPPSGQSDLPLPQSRPIEGACAPVPPAVPEALAAPKAENADKGADARADGANFALAPADPEENKPAANEIASAGPHAEEMARQSEKGPCEGAEEEPAQEKAGNLEAKAEKEGEIPLEGKGEEFGKPENEACQKDVGAGAPDGKGSGASGLSTHGPDGNGDAAAAISETAKSQPDPAAPQAQMGAHGGEAEGRKPEPGAVRHRNPLSAGTSAYVAALFGLSGDISIIDAEMGKPVLEISTAPYGATSIAVSAKDGDVYAASAADDSIGIFSLIDGKPKGRMAAGKGPCALALDEAKGILYAANSVSGDVWVYNIRESVTVSKKIQTGFYPQGVAVDSMRGLAYAANCGSGTVTVIDTRTMEPLADIEVGECPTGLCVNPLNGKCYVACFGHKGLTCIGPGLSPFNIPLDTEAVKVECDPQTNTVYATGSGNSFYIVDGNEDRLRRVVKTGYSMLTLLSDFASGRVYLADHTYGGLRTMDAASLTEVSRIASGGLVTDLKLFRVKRH